MNKQNIYCYNCGNVGHLSKLCHYPIISLGIIAIKYYNEKFKSLNDFKKLNKLLLVRRKDSIGYTEYVRGKYNNFHSLLNIINIMTNDEKNKILNKDFKNMWKDLWVIKKINFEYTSDYIKAHKRYNKLIIEGVIYQNKIFFLKDIINYSNTNYIELEWGFPKGKRNKSEKNKECAIREFNEESNLNNDDYDLLDIKPIIEDYIGTDNKKYRHIYYLAVLKNDNISLSNKNIFQQTEISKISLFNHNNALIHIRSYNKERIKIITSVYEILYHIYNNKIIL